MPRAEPTAAIAPPPLIAAEELTVRFGALTILDRISFSVAPGEIVGIVGESGSGKSMTALAVMQLLPRGG